MERFPGNEKILHQLALAYSQSGAFDAQALEVYQEAAELFPADVKIQEALSNAMLIRQGMELVRELSSLEGLNLEGLERSLERLEKLSVRFPDSPDIHQALGDLRLVAGLEKEAIHHYRCAMALGLTDLGQLCDHFSRVCQLRSLGENSAIFFAELYERQGVTGKAEGIYEQYFREHAESPGFLESYAEFLQRRLHETANDKAGDQERYLMRLARVSLGRGNTGEALTWARQLEPDQLAADPKLAKELARRLIGMEDYRQAFEYLTPLRMDQEVKALLNEMTDQLEKRGELDTAVYILQYINENDEFSTRAKAVESSEDSSLEGLLIEINTELQMAERYWKSRRWREAFDSYLRALELGHEDYKSLLEPLDLLISRLKEIPAEKFCFLALFFADRKEWRRSLGYAVRALETDPNQTEMSHRIIHACERLILENPADMDVRLRYGGELLRQGNIERAMQEFRRCAESPEHKMKATRKLAQASQQAGDLSGALSRYQELPVLEMEDLERLYDLSIAFANAGQYAEALDTARLIREYDEKFHDIENKLSFYEEQMKESNRDFFIDPKMRELIGDHSIGRYKYLSKIGSGGMGVVHRVHDLKTGEIVAMKILREGLSSSGKAIDRFFREARIAAGLHHPSIVRILDYNISNNYGQSYIAMEFVDGPTLRDLIEEKFGESVDINREDILRALDWMSQLCDALAATHRKGIIHRDIKPDNIMIAKSDIVKITDFGIVHVEEATFTPTGALIGTPRYMSPEQVHGGRIDQRSDVYSVGIILYELLIGSPPFISGDISYQQVNVTPTSPREISPGIPEEVDRIVMKCLEKAPVDRYQNALECRESLDSAFIRLGGDPERRRLIASQTARAAETGAGGPPAAFTAAVKQPEGLEDLDDVSSSMPPELSGQIPSRSSAIVPRQDRIDTPPDFDRPHEPAPRGNGTGARSMESSLDDAGSGVLTPLPPDLEADLDLD